ncbi:hypothetical protein K501DRAFT_278112 [Backusella circina FSU 941]|nr:hypothetical protein K501DRAFT_278112 [Backusella circina FSU 941]
MDLVHLLIARFPQIGISGSKNESQKEYCDIARLFENKHGVPVGKCKAIDGIKDYEPINKLKTQGYHISCSDKSQTIDQLLQESNIILITELVKIQCNERALPPVQLQMG